MVAATACWVCQPKVGLEDFRTPVTLLTLSEKPCDLSTHVINTYQCQEHTDLILEDLVTMGSHMSHFDREFGLTQFVQKPEVLGKLLAMVFSHVHQ